MGEEALLGSQRALPAALLDAGFEFEHPELDGAVERALAS
jgi:NAD dependent epimerase/dehydratase family enzyme